MLTAATVWGISYVLLAVMIVGLGLLLTHVLLPSGLGRLDLSVSQWFVAQRTPTLDTVTMVGSELGSTGAIVGVAVVAVIAFAIGRYWRQVGFIACALSLEFAVFLTATFLIDRNRPAVPRLDPSPVTSSYPSGHAAASLTLWLAVAIAVTSTVRSAFVRALAWIVAVAVPIVVGLSRVYRGMHHLTDVSTSVVLASGALLLALVVTRSTAAASDPGEEPDAEPLARTGREVAP